MAAEITCVTSPGLTLTASMVQGATVVTSGITMTESAVAGYYTGNASGAAGFYNVLFLNGATIVASGTLNWNGSAEVLFPTVAPGAAGGLLIAGSNAATTFATLTSTGSFTVNGVSDVAQTGDSFARIGAAGASLTAITGVTLAPTTGLGNQTANISGTITTVTNLTNAPTAGDLTATMKTSVNAEVLDVLATDAAAELAGVPAANASLKDKMTWLAMLARNKMTQTATTTTLRNDADSADVATSTVSDNGTTGTTTEWV